MESLEKRIQQAVDSGLIPGLVLLAGNKSGTLSYSRSFGSLSLKEDRKKEPLLPSTILRIASTTKLFTQVCALQCVDRGFISLDDDVRSILPSLKDIQLLTGYGGSDVNEPILEEIKGKITLRNLLSHSSGWPYAPMDPLVIKWRQLHGQPVESRGTFEDRFLFPLTAEPDKRWIYSPGLDWAGLVLEKVTGRSLEDLFQEYIAKPLSSTSMTFFVQRHKDLLDRRADFSHRKEDGKMIFENEWYFDRDTEECFGGMGLWTSAEDLFKVCKSLLLNDGTLISPGLVEEAMKPTLGDEAKKSLEELMKNLQYDNWGVGGGFQNHSKRDATLLGMCLAEENENTPRQKGCVAWTGYPNIFYFIDPKAGLCGVFAAQITPPGDPETLKLHIAWEKAIYAENERISR